MSFAIKSLSVAAILLGGATSSSGAQPAIIVGATELGAKLEAATSSPLPLSQSLYLNERVSHTATTISTIDVAVPTASGVTLSNVGQTAAMIAISPSPTRCDNG